MIVLSFQQKRYGYIILLLLSYDCGIFHLISFYAVRYIIWVCNVFKNFLDFIIYVMETVFIISLPS